MKQWKLLQSGDHDENEKILHDIFLKTVVKGLPVLLTQKYEIKAIAEQCAIEGGDAVYRARVWYAQFTGTMISEDDCISTGGRESLKDAQESVEKEELRLFPNPASQMLNVEYNAGTDACATLNSGISPSGLYDDNEKALNAIYLQTEAKGLPVLLAHKNTIRAIAEQCALDGGDAVYRARAWYAQLKGVLLAEEDCVLIGTRSSISQAHLTEDVVGLRLYPNPVNQNVNIVYQASQGQILLLYNQFGAALRQVPLTEGNNELYMDMEKLPSGTYYFKVGGGVDAGPVTRFVVQH